MTIASHPLAIQLTVYYRCLYIYIFGAKRSAPFFRLSRNGQSNSRGSSINYSQPAVADFTDPGADFEAVMDIQNEHAFNQGLGNFPGLGGLQYSGFRGARLGSGQQHHP